MTTTVYADEITHEEAKVLDALADGVTLVKACETVGLSAGQFMARLPLKPSLSRAFVCARDAGAEVMADSLLSIPDEVADVNRARLKADNIKWILSRRHAAKFGDRIDVNLNTTIDLTGAIAEARSRVLPMRYQSGDVIDAEPVMARLPEDKPTDNKTADKAIGGENLIPDFLK